jgi:hypothetical protein
MSHLLQPAEPAESHELMRQHPQLVAHQPRLCHDPRVTARLATVGVHGDALRRLKERCQSLAHLIRDRLAMIDHL